MVIMADPNPTSNTSNEILAPGTAHSPTPPSSANSLETGTSLDISNAASSSNGSKRAVPSLRSVSYPSNPNPMNPTSTSTGVLNQARAPKAPPAESQNDPLARARAFHQSRMNLSSGSTGSTPVSRSPIGPGSPAGGFPPGMSMPSLPGMPGMPNMVGRPGGGGGMRPGASAVSMPKPGGGIAGRRARMNMANMPGNPVTGLSAAPRMKLPPANGDAASALNGAGQGTRLSDFDKYIDSQKGWITFDGAATITKEGVNFANGSGFKISLDEIEVLDELGKGNYGTVYKVRHARPHTPRFGPGLTRFGRGQAKRTPSFKDTKPSAVRLPNVESEGSSGKVMAMKEIRLELDENKFTTILKELVILHACTSPFIIDFYGAFFQEGAVYMCIEYMDGGSIDQLYSGGIPESVMRKITYATVVGLRYLKEKHNIIHRDVKPTNILVNTQGQIKICDFGVSGNLVASLAKTNIGCQSYMAPERITQGNGSFSAMGSTTESTYSVSSDIWSLGLSIIECATGKYPYPPEVSSSILGQLNAIVDGEPPALPENYSSTAKDFVKSCLHKTPAMRPSYGNLLKHVWLAPLAQPETIAEEDEEAAENSISQGVDNLEIGENTCSVETGDPEVADWAKAALSKKAIEAEGGKKPSLGVKPALHKVALDTVSPDASPVQS